jgi:signal transduction histidine kinase/ActR/RegA family two-component response regulator
MDDYAIGSNDQNTFQNDLGRRIVDDRATDGPLTSRWLALLGQITTAIQQHVEIQELCTRVVNSLGTILNVDRCLLGIQGSGQSEFCPIAVYSALSDQNSQKLHPVISLRAKSDATLQSVWVVHDINQVPSLVSPCQALKIKSLLAVAHQVKDKYQPTVYLELHQCSHSRTWSTEEQEWLRVIAAHLGLAFAQTQWSQREVRHSQELEAAKQTAELSQQAKGLLLANMSHELRTPLNSILGFSQLLQRDASLTPKQQKILSTINRSGTHLLQLINDVLEMSKIEAGQSTLKLAPVNVRNLLNSLQEMMRLKAEGKGILLKLEQSLDLPSSIRADASKLRQVLINLFENAIKFTPEGSITLRVWQTPPNKLQMETRPRLWFEVADTGVGIASEELTTIFDAFTQTKSGRQFDEGTGLGLAISRKYVQMMGGELTADSQVNQGTLMRFWIPILITELPEVTSKRPRVMTLVPGHNPYRLLVVEDQPENRQLFVDMLQAVGFDVQSAANGEEAIVQWQSWHPHLIWMDMQMPIMDGATTAKYIKKHAPVDNSPVIIALTAYAWGQDRAKALACGCDDFISKPFNSEAIWAKLTHHLGVKFQEVGSSAYAGSI